MFDPLEPRRLFAASFDPATVLLTVTGTAGADQIIVSVVPAADPSAEGVAP